MDWAKIIRGEITDAGDVCYTCGEIEESCECEEGFDSTRARESSGNFDASGPRTVEDFADEKVKSLEPLIGSDSDGEA